jgi:hypothetical protein
MLTRSYKPYLVNIMIEEAAVGIEMNILELALADQLVGDFALEVHEEF